MVNIVLIGIDLGKNSFHIHCQDQHGKTIFCNIPDDNHRNRGL